MEDSTPIDGRKLRYQHRRAELLEQVTAYVTANGVGELSMRPLAKDLGISHATLIHHFGSKEQLLTEVVATLRDSSSLDISSGTDIVEMMTSYWNRRTSAESLPNFRLMFEIYGQALLHPERYREFLDHVVGDWLGGLTEAALALELVIRAALLYVGALLGTVVYAGLVDKNLWGHVRRWAGIMIAVILIKPVIVIVLGLAGALSADDGPNAFSAVVSGLAIILLAIFASAMIYRFVPGFGDEIAGSRNNRLMRGAEGKAAAVISSPASLVAQGIKTHSSRADNHGGGSQSSAPRPSNPASGGVAAHSARTSNGGGGSVPSAAPAPRSSSPVNTPHASNTRNSSTNRTGGEGR
ncbi:TetR/AcrR family transcriptional regulator [Streptomyces sp. NPDC002130]|uniref:TetR/AcrR family transcriptional regulator n=1 Tax=Streptomyces sp. NPDC002130 TaxID=3155568 RepID=UPI00332C7443